MEEIQHEGKLRTLKSLNDTKKGCKSDETKRYGF